MKLLNGTNNTPDNSALQSAVDAVEARLALLDLRRQELATSKKHLLSDKNKPGGACNYFGLWVQKQRRHRIEYRFRIEVLREALDELETYNQSLADAIERAKHIALMLPWKEPELEFLATGVGSKPDPSFNALTLNVLVADELLSEVTARVFKERQELEQARSRTPDNFHQLWDAHWLFQSLDQSRRNFACRFKYAEDGNWLYLSSLHSGYFIGDGCPAIPSAPCLTLNEAIALSEKLVLELWQNWHSKNIIVEAYDIKKATGTTYPLSDETKKRLTEPNS
ncbi:MAG: hypothetical protein K2X81_20020 [Candidatus Obscuribacterales bacterium]|nr:hypothetical protein [Candidatus Obscuribacterales bacterium]